MCGIAGWIGRDQQRVSLRKMSQSIAHRGPEAEGFWRALHLGWRVEFVHRRLRIVDLAPRSDQPMVRGSLTLVFNGEIYNFRELRTELEREGHAFMTSSDTEVILAAYQQWGAGCVERLEGMFAFALWDKQRSELLLVRDRLGKKPLYFFQGGSQFVFGSEIKAVLAALPGTPEMDAEALDEYLTYLYVPYPRTFFEGIRQVPPASWICVRVEGDGLRMSSGEYWDPLEGGNRGRRSIRENEEELRERLDGAVSSRMISDVPLGVLLSGGLDSSAITAVMARTGSAAVRSFSVGFAGDRMYDEIPFAGMVAERFGCRHEVLEAKASSMRSLAKIIWHFDQPFGNPTALLTYELAALTKQSVTVALGGDGGDELFGGYPRYVGAYASGWVRSLPRFLRSGLLPFLGGCIADDTNGRHQFRRLREFLEHANRPLIEMYLAWIGYFSASDKQRLYTDGLARATAGHDAGDFLRGLYQRAEGLETLNRLAYVDMRSFLCCNVLEYGDRMSMAHALELRAPFCDRGLVEFALRVPFEQKFRYGKSKWLLRRAMRRVLPEPVLTRGKLGFNPPVNSWLRGESRAFEDAVLATQGLAGRGLFRREEMERLFAEQRTGKRDVSLKIWALIVLEIWCRLYQDATPADEVAEQLKAAA